MGRGGGEGEPATYVHLRGPWDAAVDRTSDRAMRFYLDLRWRTVRYGLPAARLGGALRAAAARVPPPPGLAAAWRRRPARPRPDLDAVVAAVRRAWPELAARAERLPPEPPPHLSALGLARSTALTVFVFGDRTTPLLVGKVPLRGGDDSGIRSEAQALAEAGPAGVAPRVLGRAGVAWVQEGVPGRPLPVVPLDPERALRLRWEPVMRAAVEGLAELAKVTAGPAPPQDLRGWQDLAERAPAGTLSARARRAVGAAARDLARLEGSVLRHGDPSPQNVLVKGRRLAGFVDWDQAGRGTPGVDALVLGLSWVEQGVGLRRWSSDRVAETFRAAREGPFGHGVRAAVTDALEAAGVDAALADPIEVAFHARRLVARLGQPARHETPAALAARELEIVCAD